VNNLNYSEIAAALFATVKLRLHCNVSFCIAAKEIFKIHILTDVKTADLIKKSL
jgi:hypothetical protein